MNFQSKQEFTTTTTSEEITTTTTTEAPTTTTTVRMQFMEFIRFKSSLS